MINSRYDIDDSVPTVHMRYELRQAQDKTGRAALRSQYAGAGPTPDITVHGHAAISVLQCRANPCYKVAPTCHPSTLARSDAQRP